MALLDLQLSLAGADPALLSTRLVGNVLASAGDAAQPLVERFPDLLGTGFGGLVVGLSPDAVSLFFGEPVMGAADGALHLVLKPSDRYLELVSAVAGDFGMACDLDVHGWPILSVVGRTPTVAEAGGAYSVPGEVLA